MKATELIQLLVIEVRAHGDVDVLATGESSVDWCGVDGVKADAKIGGKPVIVLEVGDSL